MKILNITIGSLALVLLSNQGAYSASITELPPYISTIEH